jgi:hypothetical protein
MRDKDKAEIRQIVSEELVARTSELVRGVIREELKAALFRTITIERGPRQQGDPEKVVKEEQWNVLDFLAAYLPKLEGALRGLQEDTDKTKNRVSESVARLEAIGGILLGMESAAKTLAALSDRIKQGQIGPGEPHEG